MKRMITAHIPAGYAIAKLLTKRAAKYGVALKAFIGAGIAGAIAPDIDMLYFYLLDHRRHHHHTYVTHYPVLWLLALICSSVWLRYAKTKKYAAYAAIFSLNGFVHMFLDSIVGDIWWLAPYGNRFSFFSIPATHHYWLFNFIFHWTFCLELAVWAVALYLFFKPSPKRL